MRRSIIFLVAIATLPLVSAAQGLMLFEDDAGNSIANGTQLFVSAPDSIDELKQVVHSQLNGASNEKVIKVKRYELAPVPGTSHYFCWDQCFLDQPSGFTPVWVSDTLILQPGVLYFDFAAYHLPMGISGCANYRYVWFDDSSVNDSSWVDIEFCVTPTSINELKDELIDFDIYPNPANGVDVNVVVATARSRADLSIQVLNSLGQVVRVERIGGAAGERVLSIAGLEPGVYWVSVNGASGVVHTKRLVVQ